MGQSFVEIEWYEMEDLFLENGYRKHVPNRWQEVAFVKMFRDANLAVVIATSFDLDYYLRDSGRDAIRAMLGTFIPLKLPVLTLKGVRRTQSWKERITGQFSLLEELAETSPACPICGNCTIPRGRKDRTDAFWGCGLYHHTQCKGAVPIPMKLTRRFLDELPRVNSRYR